MPNNDDLQLTATNKSKQFSVVNNLYGQVTESPLNIKVLEDNYKGTKSQKVILDNQVEAYIELGEPSNSFDYKVVSSEIADLFDVKATSIHRLKSDGQEVGIIRRSNAELDEVSITFGQIAKSLSKKIQSGELEGIPWLQSIINISEIKEPITDEEILKTIIDMPLFLAIRRFEGIYKINYTKFKRDYFNTIIFDYITNQAKRSLDSYSVVGNNNTKEATFGALYSFNDRGDENASGEEYILNTNVVNREALINCLYKYYYSDIEDFSKMISDYLNDYKKSLELILKNNFKNADYQSLLSAIINNLNRLKNLEDQYSNKNKNQIDLTQTNISLQLKAKRNNNDVINRYPEPIVNEKEATIIDFPTPEVVKLTLEPDKKRSGFVNATLLILLIILVFGIGIGIGYIVFNISGA